MHIAIDDATRLAYAEVLTDQTSATAVGFLRRAIQFYARHGITVQAVLIDEALAGFDTASELEAAAELAHRAIRRAGGTASSARLRPAITTSDRLAAPV